MAGESRIWIANTGWKGQLFHLVCFRHHFHATNWIRISTLWLALDFWIFPTFEIHTSWMCWKTYDFARQIHDNKNGLNTSLVKKKHIPTPAKRSFNWVKQNPWTKSIQLSQQGLLYIYMVYVMYLFWVGQKQQTSPWFGSFYINITSIWLLVF